MSNCKIKIGEKTYKLNFTNKIAKKVRENLKIDTGLLWDSIFQRIFSDEAVLFEFLVVSCNQEASREAFYEEYQNMDAVDTHKVTAVIIDYFKEASKPFEEAKKKTDG